MSKPELPAWASRPKTRMTGNVSSLLHLSRDQGTHHFQMQLPLPTGRPGSLSRHQVDAPEGHATHFCSGWGPAEDGGAPLSLCPSASGQKGCPWNPQDYWVNHTAEMKTSVHDLNCLKQASQTNNPAIGDSGIQSVAPDPCTLLTRVNIACSDLLFVFAAGKLGAFEPLLYSHVALLNPTSTQFGAFWPGCPWAHPTAWKHKTDLLDRRNWGQNRNAEF